MKLTNRLVFLLIGSVGLVYILLQLYTSNYYATLVEEQVRLESDALSFSVLGDIIRLKKDTEATVQVASVGIEAFDTKNEEQIYKYLSQILINNSKNGGHIFGMALAFNPINKRSAPHVWLKDKEIVRKNIARQLNYTSLPWYVSVSKLKKPVWTPPYFEDSSNTFIVTYAYPILDSNGKVQAVLTADLSLQYVRDFLQAMSGKEEYIIIVSKDTGRYVAHPDVTKLALSQDKTQTPDPALQAIYQMMRGEHGSAYFEDEEVGKRYFVNYVNIKGLDWVIGIVFDADKVIDRLRTMSYQHVIIVIIGLFSILFVIYVVARSITKPLRHLTEHVKGIDSSNLGNAMSKTEAKDEITQLAQNFSFMHDELRRYIENEKASAAEKEKIESEINFAKDIQTSFLPKEQELRDDNRFELASRLQLARDVGGDLYDYFFWDKDNLMLVIGDVADKGIPAALYMSMTLAFTRVLSRVVSSPAAMASYVNNYLVRYNRNNMFVTMMTLKINLQTGVVMVMDAGHGMLYHISGKKIIQPKLHTNMALGVKSDIEFKQTTFTMNKGDMLFLYTDGATDALNPEKEVFGEDNLKFVLRTLSNKDTATNNISKITQKLTSFINGAKTEDDTAMLLFQYK